MSRSNLGCFEQLYCCIKTCFFDETIRNSFVMIPSNIIWILQVHEWGKSMCVPQLNIMLNHNLTNEGIVKKVFEFFFSNYESSVLTFSRLSGIDCTKSFFEIRPGTRFFELISIFVLMVLYTGRNSNKLVSYFEKRVEFRKTIWCNRFLRALRMLIQRVHNSKKKIESFFYDPKTTYILSVTNIV